MIAVKKTLISLLAVTLGWAVGYGYYVVQMTYFSPWGRPTDEEAILFWSAVIIFVAWVVFVLPLTFVKRLDQWFRSLKAAPLFGAVYGVLIFLLIIGWAGFWRYPQWLCYPAVVGAVAGVVYAYIGKRIIEPKPKVR